MTKPLKNTTKSDYQPRHSKRLQKQETTIKPSIGNNALKKRKFTPARLKNDDDDIKIILDTETTGLSPNTGERICEIAAIEVNNFEPTGKVFHEYINPNRKVSQGAFKVHGLSNKFLKDKPTFKDIADSFLEFIGNHPLVIHNAAFDMRFLNAELEKIGKPELDNEIIDTLKIARQKFPASPAKLDNLCKKFDISLDNRTKHGALIDTELLARVYRNLAQESDSSHSDEEPNPKKARYNNR